MYHEDKDKDKSHLAFSKDQVANNVCVFLPHVQLFFSSFGNIHKTMEISFRISLDLVSGTGMTGIVNKQPGNKVDHHDKQMMIFD